MNNNARYDRPRHCFELEVNVPRTIAILREVWRHSYLYASQIKQKEEKIYLTKLKVN